MHRPVDVFERARGTAGGRCDGSDRRGAAFAALEAGDMAAASASFAPSLVYRLHGGHPLAGTFDGKQAALGAMAALRRRQALGRRCGSPMPGRPVPTSCLRTSCAVRVRMRVRSRVTSRRSCASRTMRSPRSSPCRRARSTPTGRARGDTTELSRCSSGGTEVCAGHARPPAVVSGGHDELVVVGLGGGDGSYLVGVRARRVAGAGAAAAPDLAAVAWRSRPRAG